jgi:hypothetical protein
MNWATAVSLSKIHHTHTHTLSIISLAFVKECILESCLTAVAALSVARTVSQS